MRLPWAACVPRSIISSSFADAPERCDTTCSSWSVVLPVPAPPPPGLAIVASPPHENDSTSMSPGCLASADVPVTPSTCRNPSIDPAPSKPLWSSERWVGPKSVTETSRGAEGLAAQRTALVVAGRVLEVHRAEVQRVLLDQPALPAHEHLVGADDRVAEGDVEEGGLGDAGANAQELGRRMCSPVVIACISSGEALETCETKWISWNCVLPAPPPPAPVVVPV